MSIAVCEYQLAKVATDKDELACLCLRQIREQSKRCSWQVKSALSRNKPSLQMGRTNRTWCIHTFLWRNHLLPVKLGCLPTLESSHRHTTQGVSHLAAASPLHDAGLPTVAARIRVSTVGNLKATPAGLSFCLPRWGPQNAAKPRWSWMTVPSLNLLLQGSE